MPGERTVIAAYMLQAAAHVLLVAALLALHSRYRRSFLPLWAAGWAAGGVATLGALVSYRAAQTGGVPVGWRTAWSTLAVSGLLAQGWLQVLGSREVGRSAPVTRRNAAMAGVGAAVLAGALAAFLTMSASPDARMAVRLLTPHVWLAAAFVLSAWTVRRRATHRGLGLGILTFALVLFGLQRLAAAVLIGMAQPGPLSTYWGFADLLVQGMVAFSIGIWFLEDEQDRLQQLELRERELEEQLHHVRKLEALGHLSAGVAHDFNNLLTVVGLQGQMILEDERLAAETRDAAASILQAQERGRELVSALMAFARKQQRQPAPLDLAEVVRESRTMVRTLVGDAVVVEIDADGSCPIQADRSQVEQMLLNLATNARDAMPQGGRLEIRTGTVESDGGLVRGGVRIGRGVWHWVRVTDTGHGMSQEILSRVFDPFFTTKVRGRGTGLGLASAYGMIKQSGGYITAESRLGEGSTFTLFFPHRTP